MRRALALLALAGASWSCRASRPAPSPQSPPSAGNRLNVLLITVDTLRADHLGIAGYRRATSPRLDAFARGASVFDQAYTYWPKTRPSFVMMMTGRRPSQNGYDHQRMELLGWNPTLASVLQSAGYRTAAIVDNANVAANLGYAKGFDSYREIWEEKLSEWEGTRAIGDGAVAFLAHPPPDRPFLLWLHYVNPHAPYTPPAPFASAFPAGGGRRLPVVKSFFGGIESRLHIEGHDTLGYYVAQYDGEIAAADDQIGRVLDALGSAGLADHTLVVFLSDHGESLGEHDYYFDHGQDLFDPCLRVPLVVRLPGARPGRSTALASTLDVVPTVLDAVKVAYPPDLAGSSLLPAVEGRAPSPRERLFAQNDHAMTASFDARYKLVQTLTEAGPRYALYDRQADPGETKDVARTFPDVARVHRRELERFLESTGREWSLTRKLIGGTSPRAEPSMSPEACERLKALGYLDPSTKCPG